MTPAEAEIAWPLLGFSPDNELWGFSRLTDLTRCGPRSLKDQPQIGLELVDADGRRWAVRSMRRIGRAAGRLRRLASILLLVGPLFEIELELDPLPAVALAEVISRVCNAIEAQPGDWCEFEDAPVELAPLLAQVKAAPSIAAIYDLLGLDTFEDY